MNSSRRHFRAVGRLRVGHQRKVWLKMAPDTFTIRTMVSVNKEIKLFSYILQQHAPYLLVAEKGQ